MMDAFIDAIQTNAFTKEYGLVYSPDLSGWVKIEFDGEGLTHISDLQSPTKVFFEQKGRIVSRALAMYVRDAAFYSPQMTGILGMPPDATNEWMEANAKVRKDIRKRINRVSFIIPMRHA